MKRYTYSDSFAAVYGKPLRAAPRLVARERVSKTLSVLDVVLSIWIAEAILDDAARLRIRGGRRAPRRRRAEDGSRAADRLARAVE
jgi:hypothetical protein